MSAAVLSAEDVAILRSIIGRVKSSRVNSPIPNDFYEIGQTPDVHIVLPPATGIPSLVGVNGTGTSAPSSGDEPGSATCDVYQLINGELVSAGFSITVYNIGEHTHPQVWTLAKRTKFGIWIADRPAVTDVRCVSGSIVVTRG